MGNKKIAPRAGVSSFLLAVLHPGSVALLKIAVEILVKLRNTVNRLIPAPAILGLT